MEYLKANLDYAIFGILGLMSFLMLAFVIERMFFFRRIAPGHFATAEELDIALTRNLTAIAIVGTNAPYVGLLGTVLGILITFHDIGQGGAIEAGAVMLGLALALKATALGLIVAIPSIIFYNGLLRKADVIKARWHGLQRRDAASPRGAA